MVDVKSSTFYRWYDRFRSGRPEAFEDQRHLKTGRRSPDRVWNRIPDEVRQRVVAMALSNQKLSPPELATGSLMPPATTSRNHPFIGS
jgi:transposase-like protein